MRSDEELLGEITARVDEAAVQSIAGAVLAAERPAGHCVVLIDFASLEQLLRRLKGDARVRVVRAGAMTRADFMANTRDAWARAQIEALVEPNVAVFLCAHAPPLYHLVSCVVYQRE